MAQKIWLNGQIVSAENNHIHHTDVGFTTGLGVFDTLLCIDGVLQHGQDHFDRLIHDSQTVLGKSLDTLTYDQFKNIIHQLLIDNDLEQGDVRVRTTVTGGRVSKPLATIENINTLMSAVRATRPTPPETAIIVKDFPRIKNCTLENCKRLDYSRAYAARRKAQENGADDAILLNTDGNIACATTSNIFIEESGQLVTPPLSDGVMAGVTRKNLIKSKNAQEESISQKRLERASKIYLSNSFLGLCQVKLFNAGD